MLPKLAKLWDQRRVLFFVATNDVDAADAAIKRTQRFDARVFVAPPAFHVKRRLLAKALKQQGKSFPKALKHATVARASRRVRRRSIRGLCAASLRSDPELASLMAAEVGESDVVSAAAAKERWRRWANSFKRSSGNIRSWTLTRCTAITVTMRVTTTA